VDNPSDFLLWLQKGDKIQGGVSMDEDQPQDDFAYQRELWEAQRNEFVRMKDDYLEDSTSGSVGGFVGTI
jgi:hypothetical protein